jgi:hypothetical protein
MYNALASFMPSAGVTPMKYGGITFRVINLTFWASGWIPFILYLSPSSASEPLFILFWVVISVTAAILSINFTTLGRHVLKLLQTHIATMEAHPQMSTQRSASGGVIHVVNPQWRARLDDLKLIVSRLQGIVKSLVIGAAASCMVYVIGIAVPYIRERHAYFIPITMFMVRARLHYFFTRQTTVLSLN